MEVRDTRPWFWVLIAALAAVAVVALVIAISANNESVDEKKVVDEATAQIKEEVAGLNGAIKAAEEFQAESDELQKEDQRRIKRQVNKAVAGGETELKTFKSRLAKLRYRFAALNRDFGGMVESYGKRSAELQELETENERLDKRITRLEKQVE